MQSRSALKCANYLVIVAPSVPAMAMLVAAGLCLTVVLAWACTAFRPSYSLTRQHSSSEAKTILLEEPDSDVASTLQSCTAYTELGLGWEMTVATGMRSSKKIHLQHYAAGWPLKSFSGSWRLTEKEERLSCLWVLRFDIRGQEVVLPYCPSALGLIVDTIVSSLFFAIMWIGFGTLRSLVRRSRGRCEACGYNMLGIEGDRCPECGSRHKQK